MKFALVILVLLPFALGASIQEKRFIEDLLGGVDILDLASKMACEFGKDETEAQCEVNICPQAVDHFTHSAFVKGLMCTACCKEAQLLVKTDPGHILHCATLTTTAAST